MDPDLYWLDEAISAKQRKAWAKSGAALSDGSWPIPDLGFLEKAISSWGRAVASGRADEVKRHMLKRARALGASKEKLDQIKALGMAEAEQSLDSRIQAVNHAWELLCRGELAMGSYSSWPQEVFEDRVIVRQGEDFWSVPYSVSEDGDVAFDRDSASKVTKEWVAVEAEGAEWLARPLAEADAEPDGSRWEVVLIRAGRSKNGRIYPEKVLQQAASLFEGVRVLARSDQDHVEGNDKSVKNVVGWIEGVRYERRAIRGTLVLVAGWLKEMLLEAWKRGKRDLVGLSIVAAGAGKAVRQGGQPLVEVQEITAVSSTDIVFDPAAGGGLVKLVAAVDSAEEGKEESAVDPKLIAALKEAEATVVRALLKGLSEEDVSEIKEAYPALAEKITEAMALSDEPKSTPAKPEPGKAADTEDPDVVPVALGRFVVKEALGETKLPELVKSKIAKGFANRAFKMPELTEAIADELELWSELEKEHLVQSSGETRGQAGSGVQVSIEEGERWKAALDGFFLQEDVEIEGERIPRFRSFREAYVKGTGDVRCTGRLPRRPSGVLGISEANGGRVPIRLHEAMAESGYFPRDNKGEWKLSEAIDTTQFNDILGDSVTRKVIRDYERSNLHSAWDPIVDVLPINDFRTQRRERMGGYGNLPTVAQSGAYTALTSPTDEEVTYTPAKRGGMETITLEAITNDDIRAIRTVPVRLARAAAQTLHEFLLDFMRTNANIYDGVALAAAGHGNNISTNALSLAELSTARRVMREQQEKDSLKALGIVPAHLFVPAELEQVAYELTRSDRKPGTADNDANYVRDMNLDYAVVDYWSDANNWWATGAKDQVPLLEVGFLFGEEPELFTQDSPNVGSMFDNDQLKYKIRFIFGGAVLDFRGFFGGIVA